MAKTPSEKASTRAVSLAIADWELNPQYSSRDTPDGIEEA
jgi:hypothetical protein